jgi:hypothetical protein
MNQSLPDEIPTLEGVIPSETFKDIRLSGYTIFKDDVSDAHGKWTHAIQMYLLDQENIMASDNSEYNNVLDFFIKLESNPATSKFFGSVLDNARMDDYIGCRPESLNKRLKVLLQETLYPWKEKFLKGSIEKPQKKYHHVIELEGVTKSKPKIKWKTSGDFFTEISKTSLKLLVDNARTLVDFQLIFKDKKSKLEKNYNIKNLTSLKEEIDSFLPKNANPYNTTWDAFVHELKSIWLNNIIEKLCEDIDYEDSEEESNDDENSAKNDLNQKINKIKKKLSSADQSDTKLIEEVINLKLKKYKNNETKYDALETLQEQIKVSSKLEKN